MPRPLSSRPQMVLNLDLAEEGAGDPGRAVRKAVDATGKELESEASRDELHECRIATDAGPWNELDEQRIAVHSRSPTPSESRRHELGGTSPAPGWRVRSPPDSPRRRRVA